MKGCSRIDWWRHTIVASNYGMYASPVPELPGLAFSRPKNKFGLFKKLVGLEIIW